MFIKAKTIDDLLHDVYTKCLKANGDIGTTRGKIRELCGVLIELSNPLARLSASEQRGKVFSCLGEFLWYLSKSNKLNPISYYIKDYGKNSDDGKTIHGAYGPRFFNKDGINQVENVIKALTERPTSRKAVIQLFEAGDITKKRNDVPCTCTLQFLIRDKKLNMHTYMRSNDVVLGLPHDIFSFTMIQEMIANRLKVKVGTYKHSVGSLHLYEKDVNAAKAYLSEGYQSTKYVMPLMPTGNPWPSIEILLKAEKRIRNRYIVDVDKLKLPDYWSDIVRLLQIYKLIRLKKEIKLKDLNKIMTIRNEMKSRFFYPFIDKHLGKNK